mgnify:CR=1 FL=1
MEVRVDGLGSPAMPEDGLLSCEYLGIARSTLANLKQNEVP